jgi:predicted nicotinamide N-methyase
VARNSHLIPPSTGITVAALDFSRHTTIIQKEPFDLVLAGDVIYDDDITSSFVSFIGQLASSMAGIQNSTVSVVIATEKRYVFTLAELDTVAPAFDFFMNQLDQLMMQQTRDQGKRMDLEFQNIDFPQYFCYERSKEMVLLKLTF